MLLTLLVAGNAVIANANGSIIDDELVGCCETYVTSVLEPYFGKGSYYQGNLKQSECVTECCGTAKRFYPNKQCSTVKQEKISATTTTRLAPTGYSSDMAVSIV